MRRVARLLDAGLVLGDQDLLVAEGAEVVARLRQEADQDCGLWVGPIPAEQGSHPLVRRLPPQTFEEQRADPLYHIAGGDALRAQPRRLLLACFHGECAPAKICLRGAEGSTPPARGLAPKKILAPQTPANP